MQEKDPFAAIAKPIQEEDPFASIAKSINDHPNAPTSQPGFFSSFADSSGLSTLGSAMMHPLDTAKNLGGVLTYGGGDTTNPIINGLKGMVSNTTDNLKSAYHDARNGNGAGVLSHGIAAVPVLGPTLDRMQDQLADNGGGRPKQGYGESLSHTSAGELGTGAGLAASFLAPKIVSGMVNGASSLAGNTLRAASATPESLKLAGTRILTKGTPGELLQSALKPGVKYGAGADAMLEKSIPDILAADPNTKGISGFADAADKARNTSYHPYNDLMAPYKSPTAVIPETGAIAPAEGPVRLPFARPGSFDPSTNTIQKIGVEGPAMPVAGIDASPIANAQMRSIPAINSLESPSSGGGILSSTETKAANYQRPFSIPELDSARMDANAKEAAFYQKAGGDQHAALSNPETARVKAIGDGARSILYPQLEQDAGLAPGAVDAMQQKYGMLKEVSDIANRREPVAARHDPITLSQKVAMGGGSNPLSSAYKFVLAKSLDSMVGPDALVNSALDRFQNPLETPLVSRPSLIPRMSMGVGNGMRGLNMKIPAYTGPLLRKQKQD